MERGDGYSAGEKPLKKDYQKTTRKVILIRVLLAPFIILLTVCGTLVYHFAVYSSTQVKSELVRVTQDHGRLIDQFFREKVSNLQFVVSSFGIETLGSEAGLTAILHNLQIESKAFFDLGVFDEKGNHLAYVGPYKLTGKNYAQSEWFRAVQQKKVFISDEFLGYRNIPHFIIAVRRNEGGKTWYLRATIDSFYFNDLVESIRIGKTGEAYLINQKGVLQTKRRSGEKLMEFDPDFKNYLLDDKNLSSFFTGGRFSDRYLYAAGRLKHTKWFLVVRQQISDAYSPLTCAILISVIIIIIGGSIVVILGYILASGVASSLSLARIEKQQMRTQLIIAGKLAEVGEMSTGLAHEINNPLQVMKSELTMIEDIMLDMEEDVKNRDPESIRLLNDSVDQIGVQIDRCGRITQGLLGFARQTESARQKVELQKFLPEVVRMIEEKARVEDIRIVQELDPDLPSIVSDPDQLQQVFLNLLNNAIYALKNREFGEIRIHIFQEGENIIISIADGGCGFSPEDMEKAFIPFFTTKPVGEGTGLGLSAVYGIIKGLGGDITLTSELNAGAVFSIHLPIDAPVGDEKSVDLFE